MSHSGSYVSTSTRTSSSVAVSTEEPAARYGGILNILRRKKTWEHAALKAAKLKQEQKMARANKNKAGGSGASSGSSKADAKAREAAVAKAQRLRNQLKQLYLQKTEVEKNIQYEYKERINEYEQRSLKEEEEAMEKLRRKQDGETKSLAEKLRAENEMDEEKMRIALKSIRDDRRIGDKRKADRGGEEGNHESNKKRQKTAEGGDSVAEKGKGGDTKTSDKTTMSKGGDDGDAAEKAEKKKELGKIVEEMNYLNQTKSQMVWLLKQVITTERKMKDKP